MASYPQSQPREYHRSFSNWWWLGRFNYLKFILREFSSLFVGYFLVVTLLQLCALASGPEAYAAFQQWLREPLMIVVNIIAFLFLLLHTITWSNLVPKAFLPRRHGHRLSEVVTALPSYILWLVATIVVAAFILGAA
ncbi:MAG: fumarate reductase subunit C [Candidatus Binataceae bacterium]